MSSAFCASDRALRRVTRSAVKTQPCIPVYEITPGERHKLRVVSRELFSIVVHQGGRRPLPCYGDSDGECEHHRLKQIEQHYLFVVRPGSSTLQLVRLTTGLVNLVLPELCDEERNLNGLMLELWREQPTKKDSAMLGQIVMEETVENLLLATPDIEWAVKRLLESPPRLTPFHSRVASPRQAPRPETVPFSQQLAAMSDLQLLEGLQKFKEAGFANYVEKYEKELNRRAAERGDHEDGRN